MTTPTDKRRQLRSHLRQRRRALTATQQHHASRHCLQRCNRLPMVFRAQYVAFYCATDGEVQLDAYRLRGAHRIFLPCVQASSNLLLFRHCTPRTRLRPNRFQIPEPVRTRPVAAWTLDLVFVPLVGFDLQGNRLGMGGGFYDRLFADLNRRPRRPWLIGLAHDCQQTGQFVPAPWDLPLDALVTPSRFLRFSQHRSAIRHRGDPLKTILD